MVSQGQRFNMTDLTAAQLVERRMKLKAHVESQKEQFDNYLKPYLEGIETCDNALLEKMNAEGTDSFKTDFGTAYKSTLMNVKIVSRERYLDYVLENWDVIGNEMLQAGAQKDAVKQFIENSNGTPP